MTFIDTNHYRYATNLCNQLLALSRRATLRFFHFRFAYISKSSSINRIRICYVLGSKIYAMLWFARKASILEKQRIRSGSIARKLSIVSLTNTGGFEDRRKGYPLRAYVDFTTIRPLISDHNRGVLAICKGT